MSRNNIVNPDHYKVGGRLTPDELARERKKQSEHLFGETRGRRRRKPVPPWMAHGQDDQNPAVSDEPEPIDRDEAVVVAEGDADEAAQQPQGKPRGGARGKQGGGGSERRKTARRRREAGKQTTRTGTTRGARSAAAKSRKTPKASGARGTPRGGKAPKARGTAARSGSPQRARRPAAHKTASAGRRKAAPRKAKKR